LTFKAAYVRQSIDHQVIAPSVFGFAALALIPFFFAGKTSKWMKAVASVALASMLFVAIPANLPIAKMPYILSFPAMLFWNGYETVSRFSRCAQVLEGKSSIPDSYQKHMQGIKEANHLPPLKGTVDIFPNEINVVIASGYDYHPRPVIQSYVAYTQSLLKINRDFMQSPKAADFLVLQEMRDVYGFYPTSYDGPSWLEFLSRYEPTTCQPSGLIVKRRPTPVTLELKSLGTETAHLGEPIDLKDSGTSVLFAKINLPITSAGSLQKLFFRIYPPTISVELKNGRKESFVVPTENLKAGFIISPFVCTPEEIKGLYAPNPLDGLKDNEVARVTIGERKNDFPWHALSDNFTIELFSLERHQSVP